MYSSGLNLAAALILNQNSYFEIASITLISVSNIYSFGNQNGFWISAHHALRHAHGDNGRFDVKRRI